MRPSDFRQGILIDHRLIKIMVSEARDLALRTEAGEEYLSGGCASVSMAILASSKRSMKSGGFSLLGMNRQGLPT